MRSRPVAVLLSVLALGCRSEALEPSTSTSTSGDDASTGDDATSSTSGEASTSADSSSSDGSGSGSTAAATSEPDSTSTSTGDPASSSSSTSTTAPAPTCGDGMVDEGEVCDYGIANSDVEPDMCRTDCTPARCGDGVIDSGEECDDENAAAGDGCSEACVVELACGKTFTTWWCKQLGPTDQHTRCAAVEDGGRTCVLPEIKYGTNDGGIPQAVGDDAYIEAAMTTWCQQLGFAGWSGAHERGDRKCTGSKGPLVWTNTYDDAVWHWGEGNVLNDAYWRGPAHALNESNEDCHLGLAIMTLTCEF